MDGDGRPGTVEMIAEEAYLERNGRAEQPLEVVRSRAIDVEFAQAAAAELSRAYRIAGYLLADASDAQDAVQESCVRAWRSWPQLRDRDRFPAWFSQILVNVCRSKLRQRTRRQVEPIDDRDFEDADPFRAALARDEVGRALPALSDELRVVVVLRYWGDLSLAEIADRLEIPVGTVKSRLHAALHALRSRIEPASRSAAVARNELPAGRAR